ncbi:GFA family protein [Leptospira interrogans]
MPQFSVDPRHSILIPAIMWRRLMRISGGCHCGAIRYQVDGDLIVHALCHCADCRRHAGAPMVGWAMYAEDAVKVTQGEPKVYASSEHGRRQFCANCGTGLFYTNANMLPGIIDVQSGTYPMPFRSWCTSRSPSGSAGWSARTNCRCSTATRRRHSRSADYHPKPRWPQASAIASIASVSPMRSAAAALRLPRASPSGMLRFASAR